jgi:hypothetical protein
MLAMVLSLVAEIWNPHGPTSLMGLPSPMSPILVEMLMTMLLMAILLVSPILAMTLETFLATLYNSITNICL